MNLLNYVEIDLLTKDNFINASLYELPNGNLHKSELGALEVSSECTREPVSN